jgi:hypothetical protein
MGHSTGSQDVCHYLSTTSAAPSVDGGILQAPASDREHFLSSADSNPWSDALPAAKALVEQGKGDELLSAEVCKALDCKMTAGRLFSLLAVG